MSKWKTLLPASALTLAAVFFGAQQNDEPEIPKSKPALKAASITAPPSSVFTEAAHEQEIEEPPADTATLVQASSIEIPELNAAHILGAYRKFQDERASGEKRFDHLLQVQAELQSPDNITKYLKVSKAAFDQMFRQSAQAALIELMGQSPQTDIDKWIHSQKIQEAYHGVEQGWLGSANTIYADQIMGNIKIEDFKAASSPKSSLAMANDMLAHLKSAHSVTSLTDQDLARNSMLYQYLDRVLEPGFFSSRAPGGFSPEERALRAGIDLADWRKNKDIGVMLYKEQKSRYESAALPQDVNRQTPAPSRAPI